MLMRKFLAKGGYGALITNPSIILLDEPLCNLDEACGSAKELHFFMKEHASVNAF